MLRCPTAFCRGAAKILLSFVRTAETILPTTVYMRECFFSLTGKNALKYGLAFTLLADPERKVIEAYDVWKEKKNYGKIILKIRWRFRNLTDSDIRLGLIYLQIQNMYLNAK